MPNARDRCDVVSTGVFTFKGGVSQEGTIYRCRWCKEDLRLKVKGIFEKLDDAGKKAHVDTLNEYHKRHCKEKKCAPSMTTKEFNDSWLSEVEEDDSCAWTPTDAPAYEWKEEEIKEYLLNRCVAEDLPELFKIISRQKSVTGGCDFYLCVFRDAQQYMSAELFIPYTSLWQVPQYRDATVKAKQDFEIKEWLDIRLDNLVREHEYYEPPKKKARPSGLFSKRNTHPQCAYSDLLQVLRDTYLRGGRSYSLQKDCISRLLDSYNLTDFAPPTTIDSKLLQSTAKAMLKVSISSNAALFVKPTAIHAWLSRCALMEQPTIRLALFEDLSQLKTVETDPYGFNTLTVHELRLYLGDSSFKPPAGQFCGILCAVLTLPSLETKTAAYTVLTRSVHADLSVHDIQVALALSIMTSSEMVQTSSLRTDLIVHDMRLVLPPWLLKNVMFTLATESPSPAPTLQ